MKTRTAIATVGATALIGTGAFLLPAVAAPHATTNTYKFISDSGKMIQFSKFHVAQQDMDVNSAGKTIGLDIVNVTFDPKTHGANGYVVLSTADGILYATVHLKGDSPSTGKGKILYGTGRFKGATGTIASADLNKSGTKTAVTVTYTK